MLYVERSIFRHRSHLGTLERECFGAPFTVARSPSMNSKLLYVIRNTGCISGSLHGMLVSSNSLLARR